MDHSSYHQPHRVLVARPAGRIRGPAFTGVIKLLRTNVNSQLPLPPSLFYRCAQRLPFGYNFGTCKNDTFIAI